MGTIHCNHGKMSRENVVDAVLADCTNEGFVPVSAHRPELARIRSWADELITSYLGALSRLEPK